MTLRTRLALALALFGAAMAGAIGAFAYRATQQELRREQDASLNDAASFVLSRVRAGLPLGLSGTQPGPPPFGSDGDGDGDDQPHPGRGNHASRFRARDLQRFILVPVGPDGEPASAYADAESSLTDAIKAVARGGPTSARGDVVRGDETFRYLAVQLPEKSGAVVLYRSLAESDRVRSRILHRVVPLMVLVAAIGAVIGAWVASRITRRLKSLTEVAERVADTRSFPDEPIAGGTDEVGRLGAAFGSMVSALSEARAEQHRLVQDAGHELRTPLTSLRTNVEVLQRYGDLSPDDRTAVLRDIDAESRELSGLIDELVRLAVDPNEEPSVDIDLAELTTTVVERFRSRHGGEIRVDIDDTSHLTSGPPDRISRAVRNVIDNAVKFGGQEVIEVRLSGTVLVVRDHGPGIEPAELTKVFDRFHRAAAARSLPGSGLGLSIVKEALERAGGTVTAANHPDGGAVIELRFAQR